MTMREFYLEYEQRRPAQPGDYANGMTLGDIESIKAEGQALMERMERRKAAQNVATDQN